MEKYCSIIIPVYNKLNLTRKCVNAILSELPKYLSELIIVDDNSSDGTPKYLEYISKRHSFIKVLRNEKNRGFSYTSNRGAQIAQGKYLVFLNNDTVPLPGWLDALVEVAERNERVAVVGAKLLYPNGTIQHAGVMFGNFIFPLYPFHVYAEKPSDLPEANLERDYKAVTAACMLVKKKVFDKLRGFDERFVNGYEDVDFCLRVKKAGYRVVYTPKSVLYHLESSSPGRFDHIISNIRLLHNKWMGKIDYDVKVEPRVSIIIVNYNSWDDTLEAISSIFLNEQYERFNVIVVDNRSEIDRSDEIETLCKDCNHSFLRIDKNGAPIEAEFKGEVFFKKLGVNKGFGGGCNEGIDLALSWNADYVWLLNPDTLIGDFALYYLVSLAASPYLRDVMIIGSKLHCYPEIEKVQFDGKLVFYRGVMSKGEGQEKIMPVEFVSGASMLIRADFLKNYGFIREDFFLYFEDNEICLRALRNGFRIVFNPLSIVYHKGGATTGDFMESPISTYYLIRNSLFFYEEFTEKEIWVTLNRLEQKLFPRIIEDGNKERLEAALSAICDFFADRRGQRVNKIREESIAGGAKFSGHKDYKRLLAHMVQLKELILENHHRRKGAIKIFFDTVKTLMVLRQRLKTFSGLLN